MLSLVACLASFSALPLLLVLLRASSANFRAAGLRRLVELWSSVNAVAALTALAVSLQSGATTIQTGLFPEGSPLQITLLVDSVSALMWTLVAGVGWVICRFSVRYLDGDPNQGRYFKWVSFTLGAVVLSVLSGNLFLTVIGYLLTSVGLHFLLLHRDDRVAAKFPANLKFLFSRAGDLCLVGAATVLYREFGTANLPELFAAVAALSESAVVASATLPAAALLLAGGAIFKSAQFPFHTWLPETMEAPTPVSAIMHAGIVNAGGYILIRTAPLVVLSPAVLWGVAGLGAFTAFFAATTMQSQTSVKRSLAWSTIAQMGFMMLQCGLGAFSAAMLHIIAHSLYKAHAFLASGSVLVEKKAAASSQQSAQSGSAIASLAAAILVTTAVGATMCWVFGVSPTEKPGGIILGLVLALGLIRWLQQMLSRGWAWLLPSVGFSAVLFAAYLASFTVIDSSMQFGLSYATPIALSVWLLAAIAVLVLSVFLLEYLVRTSIQSRWYEALYVHAANGFYVDALWRSLARQ